MKSAPNRVYLVCRVKTECLNPQVSLGRRDVCNKQIGEMPSCNQRHTPPQTIDCKPQPDNCQQALYYKPQTDYCQQSSHYQPEPDHCEQQVEGFCGHSSYACGTQPIQKQNMEQRNHRSCLKQELNQSVCLRGMSSDCSDCNKRKKKTKFGFFKRKKTHNSPSSQCISYPSSGCLNPISVCVPEVKMKKRKEKRAKLGDNLICIAALKNPPTNFNCVRGHGFLSMRIGFQVKQMLKSGCINALPIDKKIKHKKEKNIKIKNKKTIKKMEKEKKKEKKKERKKEKKKEKRSRSQERARKSKKSEQSPRSSRSRHHHRSRSRSSSRSRSRSHSHNRCSSCSCSRSQNRCQSRSHSYRQSHSQSPYQSPYQSHSQSCIQSPCQSRNQSSRQSRNRIPDRREQHCNKNFMSYFKNKTDSCNISTSHRRAFKEVNTTPNIINDENSIILDCYLDNINIPTYNPITQPCQTKENKKLCIKDKRIERDEEKKHCNKRHMHHRRMDNCCNKIRTSNCNHSTNIPPQDCDYQFPETFSMTCMINR